MKSIFLMAVQTAVLVGISTGVSSGISANAWAYSSAQFDSTTTPEEAQVYRIREQEINQLKIVLGRRFSETRKPDILLRLAELYIEKYRFYFFKENEIHQALIKKGYKPKKVDHERSRAQLTAATNVCLSILKSKVPFAKMDQVYYFLGYNFEELGKHKEANKYFEIVVTRFPRSSYASEAFRNLAEAAFEDKKYAKSITYYERAAEFTKVPSYPRTLYKLAWSYFKQRRRNEALDTMKKVIALSGTDEKFVGMRDEALNDVVMFFSEAGRFDDAREYFTKFSGGPEIYVKALSKLSKLYERRGDSRLALKVNDSLITEYADKRPDLIYETLGRNVELYKKLRDSSGEAAALEKLVKYFSENSGKIAKDEDTQAVFEKAKGYLRARATEVHKEAQKTKAPKLYSRAADLYELYLRAFLANPETEKEQKEATQIRVYRADALIVAGREPESLRELDIAMRNSGDNKLRREAGATLINLLIKRIDQAKAANKDGSDAEKQFLNTAQAFEDVFPKDPLVVELGYKRARLAAAKSGPEGLSRDARNKLAELIEKYPSRAEALDAARDLVSDATKRKDDEAVSTLAKSYLANPPLLSTDKKGEFAAYLKGLLVRQSFSRVQSIEKDSDYEKAAIEYERLASAATDAEVANKAYNNAAVNYDRAGRSDDAVRVYSLLIARAPNNPAPRTELKRLASQHLWKSEFSSSAKLYSKLSTFNSFSGDERFSFARTSFYLYWGSGDLAAAYLIGNQVLQMQCAGFREQRCHDFALDVARLLHESKKPQESLDQLRRYLNVKTPLTALAEANFMIAEVYREAREVKKMRTALEQAANSPTTKIKSRVRERRYAARAAFLLLEDVFAQFSSIKLELPDAKLKASTRQKLDALEGLVSRYSNVIKLGDGEWALASFERLYDAFSGFAQELESAPMPSTLDAAGIEQYRKGLRQVSEPMRARAIEYLRQGYQKGIELHVTTPTFVALTQRLSRRLPREYPPAHFAIMGSKGQSQLKLLGFAEESVNEGWRKQVSAKLIANPKSTDAWVELGNIEAMAGRTRLARLMFEQALALNPKNVAALSNLSVIAFLDGQTIDAVLGFEHATEIAEFNRDLKLNFARALLSFHHFGPALEQLKPIAQRYSDDKEITTAFAVAALGVGQTATAGNKLNALDAEGSKEFSLWYNWCVWAYLSGNKDQKEDAVSRLKDRRSSVGSLEQSQIDTLLAVFAGGAR